ncbi:MAG: B12-binding domain-containing radical SAM protein [Aureispira sp.]
MKKLLIISFDLIRKGESKTSLAIGSINSYLKSDERYGVDFTFENLSLNMFNLSKDSKVKDFREKLLAYNFKEIDYIAISAYVWNEFLLNDLIKYLRKEFDFIGSIILGGYQISYSSNPEQEYTDVQYFISGHAEKALLDIVTGKEKKSKIQGIVDFKKIQSPYLTGEISTSYKQEKVRLETKRGCPYRCSFCAHRDLTFNKIYKHDLDKVFQEISLFKEKEVRKINIIDPIFNAGNDYLAVMGEMNRVNLSSLVSVQARFETIQGNKGDKFLDLCEKLNFNLEFGLQTAIEEESVIINRKNNPDKIRKVMKKLKERQINYEISLIYGLPLQTVSSFEASIDFSINHGCKGLTAFPLMLLKGTELYQQKEKFSLIEQKIGDYNIPVVTQSNTYSKKDWYTMKSIAENLQINERIL